MRSIQTTRLDDVLGPAESRYFAAGYRDVIHAVEIINEVEGEDTHSISARASLRYPEGWSRNEDGTVRLPHLSSVDSVILPLLTMQQSTRGGRANEYWVKEISLKAGSEPWWNLDEVPIEIEAHMTGNQTTLIATSGTIRATISLERNAVSAPPSTPESGRTDSVYSSTFRQVRCVTDSLKFNETQATIHATHQFSLEADPSGLPNGYDSATWPATTIIDYLVTMGQMVQALVYAANQTDREHMGNLWMRTMRITRTRLPEGLPMTSTTTTSVLKNRLLQRGAARIHDMTVTSISSCGVQAEATVAYTEASDS